MSKAHKLLIYTSPNLREWTHVSEFGPANAVDGVWECSSLFPLPLDGDDSNLKWVLQLGLNPGGPPETIGSGTQYFVGDFNGTHFNPDPDTVHPVITPPPSDSVVFQDFEGTETFADLGWTGTGDMASASPVEGTIGGQQGVTGYIGSRLVNTFLDGDSTTGTLTSPSFEISHRYINFLVSGGNLPDQLSVNLKVKGRTVRTATGANSERLLWHSWDVSAFTGKTAVIEVVDSATDGWGHINVDHISFSDTSARSEVANWMDWGPDFYAALTFNGLPMTDRIDIAWMSNWQYANVIPTSPWRSAMSVPRKLSLKTINEKPALVQTPELDLSSLLQTPVYTDSWDVVKEGTKKLRYTGKTMDVHLSFSDREPSPCSADTPQFGILVHSTPNLKEQTRIGYDFASKRLFVDRTKSGDVKFESTFAGVYSAPLTADSDGRINVRVLVDWSSVEVFGNDGEVSLTAQIFPSDKAICTHIFSDGGSTENVEVKMNGIASAWR